MKCWKYHLGVWSKMEDPLTYSGDENEDMEDVFRNSGYAGFLDEWGDSLQPMVRLRSDDEEESYLLEIEIGFTVTNVFIDDFPSLMQWMREYLPMVSLDMMARKHEEAVDILEKVFHVWHGHYAEDACHRCDPRGLERWHKWQEEHDRKRKAQDARPA